MLSTAKYSSSAPRKVPLTPAHKYPQDLQQRCSSFSTLLPEPNKPPISTGFHDNLRTWPTSRLVVLHHVNVTLQNGAKLPAIARSGWQSRPHEHQPRRANSAVHLHSSQHCHRRLLSATTIAPENRDGRTRWCTIRASPAADAVGSGTCTSMDPPRRLYRCNEPAAAKYAYRGKTSF